MNNKIYLNNWEITTYVILNNRISIVYAQLQRNFRLLFNKLASIARVYVYTLSNLILLLSSDT